MILWKFRKYSSRIFPEIPPGNLSEGSAGIREFFIINYYKISTEMFSNLPIEILSQKTSENSFEISCRNSFGRFPEIIPSGLLRSFTQDPLRMFLKALLIILLEATLEDLPKFSRISRGEPSQYSFSEFSSKKNPVR